VAFRTSLLTIGYKVLCYLIASGSLLASLLSPPSPGVANREAGYESSILWWNC